MPTATKSRIRGLQSSNIIARVISYGFGHGGFLLVIVVAAVNRAWTRRPTSLEARIPPCALQDHRISHRLLGPCCLCPKVDITKPPFVEAAIYIASGGEYAGKYIAACAKDECGYVGESCYVLSCVCVWSSPAVVQAPLETFYNKRGPVEAYAPRGQFA
jgi:hypothetical protein